MKMVVLDDEEIIRQGILNKIRKCALPVNVVGEAGDGFAGLEMIAETQPDIVVTDIHMPGMDGLEFIDHALRLRNDLKFVIISGHSEFEYAKRAIRFGISDYLLKPVEEDELKISLSKIVRELEEERKAIRRQRLTKMIQLPGQTAEPFIGDDEPLQRIRRSYGHYLVIVFVLQKIQLPHYSFKAGEDGLIRFAIENIMSKEMESVGRDGVLFNHAIDEQEMVYLLGVDGPEDLGTIKALLEDVLYGIERYLKLEITISIGTVVRRVEDIQQSYQHAKLALRNQMIHGKGQIYDFSAQRQPERGLFVSEADEALLLQWLRDGEAAALREWIELRMQALADSSRSRYSHLEWFCVDLYLLFRKYLMSRMNDTERLIGEMDELYYWLHNLRNWRDAVDQMQSYVGNIIGYLTKNENRPNHDIMDEVKQYLETKFHEEISLQTISERFFIHPNYFSRRFKEKFGENFHDYLLGVRMQVASRWLRETTLKIQQIAGKVGFEDAAYFSSVFRKYYGVTPKQFRDNG